MLGGDEDFAADLEQDAGQQGRRQGGGEAAHQALEASGQPHQGEQGGAHHERADGFAVAHPWQAGDQQGRARCGPGDDDGGAVAQGETDCGQGHADR
ncbi:hypothetical protein D3C84_1058570 [compost metagenome]